MNDPAQIVGLYRLHAQAWTNARHARFLEAVLIDRFIGLLSDAPRVLDIGCGSGQPISHRIASQGCALTGMDTSPELLAIAKADMPHATWLH